MRNLLAVIAFVIFTPSAFAKSPDYEAEAKRSMDAFDSTGMVLGVMVDGEVAYTGAFGKAEEGTDRVVTKDMLFPIASISKAFTTTALAILADREKIDWDDPVQKHIPEFAMYDPWVSERFTIRDMLTHRSGLPLGAGDLLFWPDGDASTDDFIAALPHLRPSAGFRAEYAYDNLLYIVAGEVVTRASGKEWADFVSEEIFKPVGLNNCVAKHTLIPNDAKVVRGHERAPTDERGTPMPDRIFFLNPDMASAGGIFCPVADMMTWAKFWLDGGVTKDGDRVISERQVDEVWRGVTPLRSRQTLKDSGLTVQSIYALGWIVQDFEGRRMVTHSGGWPGVASNFILIPEERIAVFASSNDYRQAAHAVTYQLADGLIGDQDFDFIEAWGSGFKERLERATSAVSDAVAQPENASSPSLPLDAYVGTYRDAWYGDVSITVKDSELFIDMGRSEVLDGALSHYDGNRFTAFWPDPSLKADAFVDFTIEDDEVVGVKMKAISKITDFSYDFHDLDLVRVKTN
ncbi:MAG: serine hydrolase [Pseudomonadota bacterium]